MNRFDTARTFDRVLSVEMFEHMRNYHALFERIHGWLDPGGRFFLHIFVHRAVPYAFIDSGPSDWMSRHFFSGGIMPSDELPLRFQEHLRLVHRWRWNGQHYEKTANAWLAAMDERRTTVVDALAHFFHGLRRNVRVCPRPGVVGGALSVPAPCRAPEALRPGRKRGWSRSPACLPRWPSSSRPRSSPGSSAWSNAT
jgi:SAM-dependent methyltransferase